MKHWLIYIALFLAISLASTEMAGVSKGFHNKNYAEPGQVRTRRNALMSRMLFDRFRYMINNPNYLLFAPTSETLNRRRIV